MKAFMAARIGKWRIGETEKGRHKKKVKARRSSPVEYAPLFNNRRGFRFMAEIPRGRQS